MAPDSIIVMDDARRMVGDILETYSHGGATFAKVRTGPGQTDFVELPDNLSAESTDSGENSTDAESVTPETPNYLLYCHECGHPEKQDDGSVEQVGEKEHVCAHEGSAEALRRIHEAKHGHDDAIVLPTAERGA